MRARRVALRRPRWSRAGFGATGPRLGGRLEQRARGTRASVPLRGLALASACHCGPSEGSGVLVNKVYNLLIPRKGELSLRPEEFAALLPLPRASCLPLVTLTSLLLAAHRPPLDTLRMANANLAPNLNHFLKLAPPAAWRLDAWRQPASTLPIV